MIEIRTMRFDEIAFGLELCRHAGWNQVEADWRRFFELGPEGMFLAECDGCPCATASTVVYGGSLAWIGMMVVHPRFRRRGVARAMMRHCVAFLERQGMRTIKLDATDTGLPLYLEMGFQNETVVCRHVRRDMAGLEPRSEVHAITGADWPAIAVCDAQVFGADRVPLLKLLARDGFSAVAMTPQGPPAYAFARAGHTASFLGPIGALDPDAATRVIETLLAQVPAGEVYWDVPVANEASVSLAESLGFAPVRQLTRMWLGSNESPGALGRLYGTGSGEWG